MSHLTPIISVIISTYNSPVTLRLVLQALAEQDRGDFEVIIADDGSDDETKNIIAKVKSQVNYNIQHVWQPHDNFRVAKIRNKSVAVARGEYLIFLDGDSLPPLSFISNHKRLAEYTYFVAGNRILLSRDFTTQVLEQQLPVQRWSWWRWLYACWRGKINRFTPSLTLPGGFWRYLCRTKWQGAKTCNLGVWKKDFLVVNGFDENYYGWGYEDSDLVVRLIRHGIRRKDGRFMITVFHLWHLPNRRDNEAANYKRLEATLRSSHIKAPLGIDQYMELA